MGPIYFDKFYLCLKKLYNIRISLKQNKISRNYNRINSGLFLNDVSLFHYFFT